ncbi:hypothetical protein [Pseudomonas auratipiscis]|uniref:Secreted protein n=1 Tax=Pseudomonas auratipiscis TaxID=3115853 RepID=A0AB35X2W5_9PSED|nr:MULTISPECIES: hypothetical protein [unclassified Pseudomonas]MEE1869555.1 hypothetical protein [Pseudomonas sp. 120P]MEE1960444.1 hypothetical protein [Pseudomonas sp. 119P]
MKLEIARGLFLVAALGVATAAVAAWEEPGPVVFSHAAPEQCPLPRVVKSQVTASPDHDLLLFLFGMSQGLRPQS